MKLLIIFSVGFCTAYGFNFPNIFTDRFEIFPHNECLGQPNGMRLPHANCSLFILCDSGVGLTLSCRNNEPHFDRCNQRCVDNELVCHITDCGGGLPTTPPTTTTVFVPPTVPVSCPVPCENLPHNCGCNQQWRCINGVCQCDSSVSCIITRAQCMADPECGGFNGCSDRCECANDNVCFCNRNTQCPFNTLQCTERCGCADNCDCKESQLRCFCHESCRCFGNTSVCPVTPAECPAFCGCRDKCVCNGNMCTCDPGIICS